MTINCNKLNFHKYHGTGNDFIMLNLTDKSFFLDTKTIQLLCNRHFGIGADGLIILTKSEQYAFTMLYFNSDGKEGSMCGNGGRAAAAFAYRMGIVKTTDFMFEATDGLHHATVTKCHDKRFDVTLSMKDIESYTLTENSLLIDTGSPHYVLRNAIKNKEELDLLDVKTKGAALRNDNTISENGVNVNFIYYDGTTTFVRTYERGVEDETLSCGTGATAAAIATALWYNKNKVDLHTSGGRLHVCFERENDSFRNIILKGIAEEIFEGTIYISG